MMTEGLPRVKFVTEQELRKDFVQGENVGSGNETRMFSEADELEKRVEELCRARHSGICEQFRKSCCSSKQITVDECIEAVIV